MYPSCPTYIYSHLKYYALRIRFKPPLQQVRLDHIPTYHFASAETYRLLTTSPGVVEVRTTVQYDVADVPSGCVAGVATASAENNFPSMLRWFNL